MTNNQKLKTLTDKYDMRPVDVWYLLDGEYDISIYTVLAWFKNPQALAYRNMTDDWLEKLSAELAK